tara:strand:+ start:120 stop:539 length:420 start_codon:yes stop_codon:yes gene_type:complete
MGNVISGGGKYFAGKFKLGKIEGQLLAGDEKAGFGPRKPCPPDEPDCKGDNAVVISGDESKVNEEVTKTNLRDKRKEEILYKRSLLNAKHDEKKKEYHNMRQVRKDLITNVKLQLQRKREGKDYQKGTGTNNQQTIRRS